jgi:cytochrome bd ubiquinol oxidase subunit II
LIAFISGVVMGSLIRGIPLDAHKEFMGSFSDLVHPYPLLVGLLTVALFAMHGSIYIVMKTEGEFHDKMRVWINPAIITFIILYAITTVATLIYMPHMSEAIKERPVFFLIALINMLAIANIPREIYRGRDGVAFACSCLNIVCLMALYGIGTFPNIIRAINDPAAYSLTMFNSASSVTTLEILILFALIGIPLVASYTIGIYWVFHGKVKLESTSY